MDDFGRIFSEGQSVDNTAVIAQLESQTWVKLSTEICGDPFKTPDICENVGIPRTA